MHGILAALIACVSPHTPLCLRPRQTLREPPDFSPVSEHLASVPLPPVVVRRTAVALSTYVREEHNGHADPLCLLSRAHSTSPVIVAFVPAPGCQDRVAAPCMHCLHLAGLTIFSEHRGPPPHLQLWPDEMCWSQVCALTALQRKIHRTFSKATWLSGSLRQPSTETIETAHSRQR
jgi:hypothetical protein